MSKKFRRLYETAFDSKISKSDEDLLSADKQDAVIAHRMSDQLQLSASTSSVQQQCGGGGGGVVIVRASSSARLPYKSRLFGFLLHQKRRNSVGPPQRYANYGGKYPSSDSVVTSSSVSLESITSDSLSSHSSESPCYKSRFPEPHVLSPISDKSSQDATVAAAAVATTVAAANITAAADAVVAQAQAKTKPPQSLGLIKLNRDHQQHHGSDSGISVGSKPGDTSYQELLDLPFDMPKLRRKRIESEASRAGGAPLPPESLPFDMPKLRRKQMDSADALPFDVPELRRRQTDMCARGVISSDFEIGTADGSASERLEDEDPLDVADPKAISGRTRDQGSADKPDRNNLFLDVTSNSRCVAVANAINKLSPKTFQNKNQLNRPTLSLSNIKPLNYVEDIDVSLSLDQQCWYHGPMNRLEAEKVLYDQGEGSYLVRGNHGSYALSIKSAKGFIHIRIIQSREQNYLGQSDRPFDTIPDLIRHYTRNKLPVKGAEHIGLIRPVALQIL